MISKTILLGRLGKDTELKYTAGGAAVCKFSLATSEAWVDKQGQKQEKTEWHNITVFGKTGENCNKFLNKGSLVYIEGKNQTTSYEKDGQKLYFTSVTATIIKFLDSKKDQSTSGFDKKVTLDEPFAGAAELERSFPRETIKPSFTIDSEIPF